MAVAVGDQRRRREAMELLVGDIARSDDEITTGSLKVAIEVGTALSLEDR
jgi:hypothetical protein